MNVGTTTSTEQRWVFIKFENNSYANQVGLKRDGIQFYWHQFWHVNVDFIGIYKFKYNGLTWFVSKLRSGQISLSL